MPRSLLAVLSALAVVVASLLPGCPAASVPVTINTQLTPRQVSADLYGVFFEELNHAGEGGLYAQQIQNRAFESKTVRPWSSLTSDCVLSITNAIPVTVESPHYLEATVSGGTGSGVEVGVQNPGWWGISLANHSSFSLSLWAYSASITSITASLTSADHSTVYARTTLSGVTKQWSQLNGTLQVKPGSSDPHAVFTLTWSSTGSSDSLFLDVISVFPTVGWRGLPFIRADLADMIEAIHPSVVRLPGGSYVDGVNIAGRFEWNKTLYGLEHRPGHANLWGYWGEDGFGIYEMFSWAEKLTDVYGNAPRVVWVVNAGVSYGGETISPDQLDGWIQDAINSVEFATGDASSTHFGAIRAAMGHPEPFKLHYMAIGNENCQGSGAPVYLKYYPSFYAKIKAAYPDLQLLANCNEPALGKFDLYDWHTYPSPNQMYGMGHVFDNYDPNQLLFVSEYAARGGDAGNGTLDAALSEAVFMNGMEVNSHVIKLASYAPLFANVNGYEWLPDAIYFDSSKAFGTPSYWTQVMYGNSFQGLQGPPRTVNFTVASPRGLSVSVTVGALTSAYGQGKGGADTVYIVRLVNYLSENTTASVDMQGLPASASFPSASDLVRLQSATSDRADLNSFTEPRRVAPQYSTLSVSSAAFDVLLPAFSLSMLRVYVKLPSASTAQG